MLARFARAAAVAATVFAPALALGQDQEAASTSAPSSIPASRPSTIPASAPASAPASTPADEAVSTNAEAEAIAYYDHCRDHMIAGEEEQGRACLQALVDDLPDTAASHRARGALEILALRQTAHARPDDAQPWMPPGRLELVSVGGLFGIWNGIALGVSLSMQWPQLPEAAKILGSGSLAVGLGVGYGVGGYFLAEALELGEADARLVASGLVWGTNYGVPLAATLVDLVRLQEPHDAQLALGTVVAAGFLGGGAALGLTRLANLESPQVSMINSGGWVGSYVGLLSLTVLGEWEVQGVAPYALSYVAFGTAGLLAGAGAAQLLELSWGETLLCDLGAVLGSVAAATAAFSLDAAGAVDSLDDNTRVVLLSGSLAGGAVLGLAGTAAGLSLWRHHQGEPVWRLADLAFEPTIGVPVVLVNPRGEPTVLAPVLAGRW